MRHGEKKKGELLEDDLDCLLQEIKDMQLIASTDFSALCFRLDTKKTKANLLTRRYRHFSLDKAKRLNCKQIQIISIVSNKQSVHRAIELNCSLLHISGPILKKSKWNHIH